MKRGVILILLNFAYGWISNRGFRSSASPRPLTLTATKETGEASTRGSPSLSSLLEKHHFHKRICTIKSQDLPRVAEIYIDGKTHLANLVAFQGDEHGAPPRAVVYLLNASNESCVNVDLSQVTTVWDTDGEESSSESFATLDTDAYSRQSSLPTNFVERTVDALYLDRVGRARSNALTKKQVAEVVQVLDSPKDRDYAGTVLRSLVKAGAHYSRLVDSRIYAASLQKNQAKIISSLQRAVCAIVLSEDARSGGRFKRFPSLFLGKLLGKDGTVDMVTIANGGWLVLDRSVRAGQEAQKFVERSQGSEFGLKGTRADERIVRRLECLAVGEKLVDDERSIEGHSLELDLRETLKSMNLPINSQGAKTALISLGRWTEGSSTQFWPKEVIQAASWYVDYASKRREEMFAGENRIDLTHLPAVCIDAQRAAFRDDAIGVRPRKDTGRKIDPEASKWEILIHITDTSDIHCPGIIPHAAVEVLRNAACNRGTSRYDLDQPLHLLPPVVLRELSISARKRVNRCVTLWVYIDERDGRVLDAGVERTVIPAPYEISFEEASDIMNSKDEDTKKIRAVLLIAERNMNLWTQRQLDSSKVAKNREERLKKKEMTSVRVVGQRDDGSEGFIRSRGHRLVDASMAMHSFTVANLLRRSEAPIPWVRGADGSRGGRLASSPLRRFVCGQAQRQVLAVCCNVGRSLTATECRSIGAIANRSRNDVRNVTSQKRKTTR